MCNSREFSVSEVLSNFQDCMIMWPVNTRCLQSPKFYTVTKYRIVHSSEVYPIYRRFIASGKRLCLIPLDLRRKPKSPVACTYAGCIIESDKPDCTLVESDSLYLVRTTTEYRMVCRASLLSHGITVFYHILTPFFVRLRVGKTLPCVFSPFLGTCLLSFVNAFLLDIAVSAHHYGTEMKKTIDGNGTSFQTGCDELPVVCPYRATE